MRVDPLAVAAASPPLAADMTSLAAHGPVEFGHHPQAPGKSGVAAAAASPDDAGARLSGGQVVIASGDTAGAFRASRSVGELGEELSDRLPFERYRVRSEGDQVVVEGKLNPWVKLSRDKKILATSRNPKGKPPPGKGWVWKTAKELTKSPSPPVPRRGPGPGPGPGPRGPSPSGPDRRLDAPLSLGVVSWNVAHLSAKEPADPAKARAELQTFPLDRLRDIVAILVALADPEEADVPAPSLEEQAETNPSEPSLEAASAWTAKLGKSRLNLYSGGAASDRRNRKRDRLFEAEEKEKPEEEQGAPRRKKTKRENEDEAGKSEEERESQDEEEEEEERTVRKKPGRHGRGARATRSGQKRRRSSGPSSEAKRATHARKDRRGRRDAATPPVRLGKNKRSPNASADRTEEPILKRRRTSSYVLQRGQEHRNALAGALRRLPFDQLQAALTRLGKFDWEERLAARSKDPEAGIEVAERVKELRELAKWLEVIRKRVHELRNVLKAVAKDKELQALDQEVIALTSRHLDQALKLAEGAHAENVAHHAREFFHRDADRNPWLDVVILQEVNDPAALEGEDSPYTLERGPRLQAKSPRIGVLDVGSGAPEHTQTEYYPILLRKGSHLKITGQFVVDATAGDRGEDTHPDDLQPVATDQPYGWNKKHGSYRPIVVYELADQRLENDAPRIWVAVVHTTPEASSGIVGEFNRQNIYAEIRGALKRLSEQARRKGYLLIVGGDYYLTAEAAVDNLPKLTAAQKREVERIREQVDAAAKKTSGAGSPEKLQHLARMREQAKHRAQILRHEPGIDLTAERRIRQEAGLELVQPVTGTNPKNSTIDPFFLQIADFYAQAGFGTARAGILRPEGRLATADSEDLRLSRYWRHFSDHFPIGGVFANRASGQDPGAAFARSPEAAKAAERLQAARGWHRLGDLVKRIAAAENPLAVVPKEWRQGLPQAPQGKSKQARARWRKRLHDKLSERAAKTPLEHLSAQVAALEDALGLASLEPLGEEAFEAEGACCDAASQSAGDGDGDEELPRAPGGGSATKRPAGPPLVDEDGGILPTAQAAFIAAYRRDVATSRAYLSGREGHIAAETLGVSVRVHQGLRKMDGHYLIGGQRYEPQPNDGGGDCLIHSLAQVQGQPQADEATIRRVRQAIAQGLDDNDEVLALCGAAVRAVIDGRPEGGLGPRVRKLLDDPSILRLRAIQDEQSALQEKEKGKEKEKEKEKEASDDEEAEALPPQELGNGAPSDDWALLYNGFDHYIALKKAAPETHPREH